MSLPRPLQALAAAALVAATALGPAHSASAAAAQDLPSADQLKSALLTANDLGPGFTENTETETESPSPGASPTPGTGCDVLSDMITRHAALPDVTDPHAQTTLDGPDGDPTVTQSLVAEDPARLTGDVNKVTDAIRTCHTLTFFPGTSEEVAITVTPVTLGDRKDAPAVRLDGKIGVFPVTGYLGIERFGNVGMVLSYFQLGDSGSPGASPSVDPAASTAYRTAVAKVEHTLGGKAGSTTAPTAAATKGMSV